MSYLTTEEANQIQSGISLFIRMISLPIPSNQDFLGAEEQDLIQALENAKDAAEATRRMLGKQKHQGVDFNAPESILQDMETFLLQGDTDEETAMLRKQHQPMYNLVIEPTVNVLAKYPHEEILDLAEPVFEEVIDMVRSCEDYGSEEDAVEALQEYRKYISERNAARKALRESVKKKPRRSLQAEVAELFEELDSTDEPDDE